MQQVKLRDLFMCSAVAFALWVLTWLALVVPTNPRITWDRLASMPLETALSGVLLLLFGSIITGVCLTILYRLVGMFRPSSRVLGELLYILLPGFCMMVMLSPGNSWYSLPFAWVFFSLPALFSVLSLHGLEWYRRRKAGQA